MEIVNPLDKKPVPGILKKLLAVRQEIGSIGKNKKMDLGQGRGYAYRGIDDLYLAAQQALDSAGVVTAVAVMPETVKYEYREVETKYGTKQQTRCTGVVAVTFLDPDDGSNIMSTGFAEGLDDSDKASGKATSYGMKNVYFHMFSIPTEDPDAERPDTTRAKKQAKPDKQPELVTKGEFNEARFVTELELATSLVELKNVWDSIPAEYRKYSGVIDAKEIRKQKLQEKN